MSTSPRIFWLNILIPLLAAIGAMGICYVLYLREADPIEKNLLDRESRRVEIFAQLLEKDVQSVVTNLQVLDDGDGLHAYLSSHQQSDLDRAIHRAQFFSRQQSDYDQVRYLDEHGQEIVRVNFNGVVVPHDQLQNKADRPYFQKASKLAPGQIYISALDLNVENGHIEEPLKPMLRFAMPVFDDRGQRRGIYIINYQAKNLITRLQQFVPQYQNRLRMLNAQGYWLKAAQPALEWGFMFSDRQEMTLARSNPVLWKQIIQAPEGQVRLDGGLFSWSRVKLNAALAGNPDIVVDDDFLVVASEVSASEWSALFVDLRETFMVIALVLLLLLAVSWRFFYLRQRTEETLLRSQQMFKGLFENAPDAIILVDQAGHIVRINAQGEALFGFTRAELKGRSIEILMPERYRARDGKYLAGYFAAPHNRERGVGLELFGSRKDGSEFPVDIMLSSLETAEGIHALAIIRNVTSRKQAEIRIQKLNEELKGRADQLEVANKELEAFSYSVSHDLRAPLRHVDGFVDMLSKHSAEKLDERGRRYLKVISNSAKQMGTLIDELLVFSRMGRIEMRQIKVEMNLLVNEAVEAMKMDVRDRHINWKIDSLPPVEVDASMIRQVWINLITNAVKYTRPRDPAEIEIGWTDAAGERVFFIRDNGVGFDMQYADKLFGVFQRLHRAEEFEGTGIGLANVRRIIVRHGGRTWAESKIDNGATFFFSLPKKSTEPT